MESGAGRRKLCCTIWYIPFSIVAVSCFVAGGADDVKTPAPPRLRRSCHPPRLLLWVSQGGTKFPPLH